ncbi:hypothetical protein AKJ64_00250 [candidate division MSBL1 archaeon SCGC-AAA259E17]|uniref:Uncharacterized protein n=1 Tax=candidate division MSBL1 archaeon SCGC-AAA259E17 TaxID=1698263 RepID=A0A133UHA9_9EURY|nr:hypothetical protein AKJ64_00250 [candidate division MSBL1 archaeon SCGC-AAA259E17]
MEVKRMGKYLAVVTLEDKGNEFTDDEFDMATVLDGMIDRELNPDVTVYKLERFADEATDT